MCSDEALHMHSLPLLRFFPLLKDGLLWIFLEVFELELLLLSETAIFQFDGQLEGLCIVLLFASVQIKQLLGVMVLTVMLRVQMGDFEHALVFGSPVSVLRLEPLGGGPVDTLLVPHHG